MGVMCSLLVGVVAGAPRSSLFTPELLRWYPVEGKTQVMIVHARYGTHTMAGNFGLENFTSRGFALVTPKQLMATSAAVVNSSLLIWMNLEEPNNFLRFYGIPNEEQQWKVLKKQLRRGVEFTLCPYSAAWINAMVSIPRRVPIVYPYPAADSPALRPPEARLFDVIYVGNRCSLPLPVAEAFERMGHFQYRWVGQPKEMRCTSLNITHTMKFRIARKLVAQARVALVHNVLGTWGGAPPEVLRNNSAFGEVFKAWDHCAEGKASRMNRKRKGCLRRVTMPQLKERTMVAAATGTVMLVYNASGSRVMEEVFEPERHFLYWNNASDFEAKLREVLAHYEAYVPMALRARQHVFQHYTVERFVDHYIVPLATRIAAENATASPPTR